MSSKDNKSFNRVSFRDYPDDSKFVHVTIRDIYMGVIERDTVCLRILGSDDNYCISIGYDGRGNSVATSTIPNSKYDRYKLMQEIFVAYNNYLDHKNKKKTKQKIKKQVGRNLNITINLLFFFYFFLLFFLRVFFF